MLFYIIYLYSAFISKGFLQNKTFAHYLPYFLEMHIYGKRIGSRQG